ncbi:hypothetical protein P7K49_023108 [Saguinus oedipus]|uniref:Uncharacterized protein n=1 Tax=Saguinus oedipus TaxID=9490 RepID=A0ABQ9UN07_SAGOE|nr:hypothetical protein P7K49_023108 [Saguinus oedipus]
MGTTPPDLKLVLPQRWARWFGSWRRLLPARRGLRASVGTDSRRGRLCGEGLEVGVRRCRETLLCDPSLAGVVDVIATGLGTFLTEVARASRRGGLVWGRSRASLGSPGGCGSGRSRLTQTVSRTGAETP